MIVDGAFMSMIVGVWDELNTILLFLDGDWVISDD
jgi:hypothetical protein